MDDKKDPIEPRESQYPVMQQDLEPILIHNGVLVLRYARPDEREEVARRINPDTAETFGRYGDVSNPYGDYDGDGNGFFQYGKLAYAVDPEERIAVEVDDLPEATRRALDARERNARRPETE
jgi:hypothetical protein